MFMSTRRHQFLANVNVLFLLLGLGFLFLLRLGLLRYRHRGDQCGQLQISAYRAEPP